MGILTLGAEKGCTVLIEVDGDEAEALIRDLEVLLTKEDNE
jgi:phosphotransferase system HPr-like phosphotransfer protein